ncbi:thiamine pyrophosphate-dependent enzyme [Plantactinospora sp. BB1]|uniref:thiamine pyrophosphate-dependent enzyme n=1 Tax=Plantactinospora sp. BB1 TaxID=2071627 RepID=UPI000D1534F6|nr:thiamine pyrophosphate-dependent enzyme [Plantactinospora sp. BB1]AVT35608.1 thiamine pyrophosphate-binding protein [Plantactinospora sp. BB1]
MTTVRDATLTVLRRYGVDRIFGNPGSTEVAFLADLPDDLTFVLALHEGSVVGMATGHALATERPAVVNLHTTAGLGNAVGALATARVNRAALVVLVGQQDRRHLAAEPFLAGRLDQLAGPYPVWVEQPVLAQDVPAAVRRAWHEATLRRGPALVVVPMDDWTAEVDPSLGRAAPERVHPPVLAPGPALDELARLVDAATAPVLVVGAGADDRATWDALTSLADRIGAPVWQEAFGARAGFPQHHPRFAGHLPAARSRLRATLDGHDLALVVGTAAFRQYVYEPGPLLPAGLTVAVVSADPAEVHRSEAEFTVLADPAACVEALAARVTRRNRPAPERPGPAPVPPPGPDEPLRATHVFAALARRLPADVVLVEETPSTRPDLHRMLPARQPRGFVSAAMGGLGFGLPAAAGLRLGDPTRPVVAILGDGSALYAVQGLWSAARYGCGVLYVVLANGRYAVLDRLTEQYGGKPPWPAFGEVDVYGLARSFGCPARRIRTHPELLAVLDEVVPGLAERTEPLLLDVAVSPEPHFAP